MTAQIEDRGSRIEDGTLAEATVAEWTWKTTAMRDMTVAVCRLAIERGVSGEFSALDLPVHGADEHGGTGIAGSVFRVLADHDIIAAVGVFVGGQFFAKTIRNAGGNPVKFWRLKSPSLARELLRRHDPDAAPAPRQEEMAI